MACQNFRAINCTYIQQRSTVEHEQHMCACTHSGIGRPPHAPLTCTHNPRTHAHTRTQAVNVEELVEELDLVEFASSKDRGHKQGGGPGAVLRLGRVLKARRDTTTSPLSVHDAYQRSHSCGMPSSQIYPLLRLPQVLPSNEVQVEPLVLDKVKRSF